MDYLFFKSLHLILIISWMAGLFYIPRLFVYVAQDNARKRTSIYIEQQKRLLYFTSPLGLLGIIFGALMLAQSVALLDTFWFKTKLVLVGFLVLYNIFLFIEHFRQTQLKIRTVLQYKFINEVVVLILIPIVFLSVFKWQ
ncbi:MAG: CopD family protein [Proteobacteria bacterium]|uniref:Protoporphyrinogen IX oxidase n=1 Tax=SAR86 cluster bacterium TaxID=2030880 RepID=A0A937IAA9_9GAMM|nr:CopD family protein [SAR86 cluster bacterium]MBL6819882.1 CopD family protein [SAR86 cluster bacterium]MDA0344569.1 CopD family protein [Pseudomonadota bacterium]MDA0899675.1 CopD family protein [Pseudomonadota bacterium]